MTQVAKRQGNMALTAGAQLPDDISPIIGFEAWAQSIVYKTPYKEPNPDYISTMLALQSIQGETVEDVFAQANILKAQDIVPNSPGQVWGPFELTSLYVAESDFETGNPCYVILTGFMLDTLAEFKCTTGATNVQATLIGLLKLGHWPIRAKFKRGESKDRGGRYLLNLLPPD